MTYPYVMWHDREVQYLGEVRGFGDTRLARIRFGDMVNIVRMRDLSPTPETNEGNDMSEGFSAYEVLKSEVTELRRENEHLRRSAVRLVKAKPHTVEVEAAYSPFLDCTVYIVKGPGYRNILTPDEFNAKYEPVL